MRGYFGIGIWHGKAAINVGTLWRSAYQLGAAFIFTIGKRYPKQASDTVKAWKHVPLYEYDSFDDFQTHRPKDCMLVGVEMGGKDLVHYCHHERAIYLLGAEDNGLSKDVIAECQNVIAIPALRTESYNVAVAGSIVMFDRLAKSLAPAPQ
jgi:tRNA G18 (ribose-2'-O)-methylase SpoU